MFASEGQTSKWVSRWLKQGVTHVKWELSLFCRPILSLEHSDSQQ